MFLLIAEGAPRRDEKAYLSIHHATAVFALLRGWVAMMAAKLRVSDGRPGISVG